MVLPSTFHKKRRCRDHDRRAGESPARSERQDRVPGQERPNVLAEGWLSPRPSAQMAPPTRVRAVTLRREELGGVKPRAQPTRFETNWTVVELCHYHRDDRTRQRLGNGRSRGRHECAIFDQEVAECFWKGKGTAEFQEEGV